MNTENILLSVWNKVILLLRDKNVIFYDTKVAQKKVNYFMSDITCTLNSKQYTKTILTTCYFNKSRIKKTWSRRAQPKRTMEPFDRYSSLHSGAVRRIFTNRFGKPVCSRKRKDHQALWQTIYWFTDVNHQVHLWQFHNITV